MPKIILKPAENVLNNLTGVIMAEETAKPQVFTGVPAGNWRVGRVVWDDTAVTVTGYVISPSGEVVGTLNNNGDSTWTVDITSPAEYVGTYTTDVDGVVITTALLDSGEPIRLKNPTTSESPTDTLNRTAGLYLSPSDDVALNSEEWYLGDTNVVGTGPSYTMTQADKDTGQNLYYEENAANSAASLVPYRVLAKAAPIFDEGAVVFTGSNWLSSSQLLNPTNEQSYILCASFTLPGTLADRYVWGSNSFSGRFWTRADGSIEDSFTYNKTPAGTVAPNNRVNVIHVLNGAGSYNQMAYQINGGAWMVNGSGTYSAGNFTAGNAVFGSRTSAGSSANFIGTMHRFALWVNPLSSPDVSLPSVQEQFFRNGTCYFPAASQEAYGDAASGKLRVDFNGKAAAYNAGTHQGALNAFTPSGTFANA